MVREKYIRLFLISLVINLLGQGYLCAQDSVLDSLNNSISGLTINEKVVKLKDLALMFRNTSLERALHFANERESITIELGSDSLKADNLNLLGNIYLSSGLYSQAKSNYIESLRIFKGLIDYNGCATETHNLGLLYYNQNDTIKAVDYFKQSHTFRLMTKNNRRIGDGLTTLGEIYLNYGYYEKSVSSLSSAINYYSDQVSYHRKYDCMAYLFDNFLLLDPDIAFGWMVKMEELYLADTTNTLIDPKRISFRHAQYYINKGNLKKAVSLFEETEIESFPYKNEYIPPGLFSDFTNLLASKGYLRLSLYYSELARKFNRDKYNTKLKETISSYKTRLNIRTTNEEILRTQELNSIIIKRIRTERIINFSMLTVISILIFVLVALIYNLFRIKRSQHILNLRNADLRIGYNKNISYQKNTLTIKNNKNTFFNIISNKLAIPFSKLNKDLQELSDQAKASFNKEMFLSQLDETYELSIKLEKSLKRILLWSKLQRNKYEIRSEEILILDYLHELLPEFLSMSVKKNIKISFDIDSDLKVIYDKKSLKSILKVLVENSVDNSNRKTDIIIRAKQSTKESYISVTDFGLGIPANIQSTIFDINLSNGDYSYPNNKNRLGLGLLLSKKLTELNNSILSFESKVNKGTTFYIQIKK